MMVEVCEFFVFMIDVVGGCIKCYGGVVLIIDYGDWYFQGDIL